MKLEDLLRLHKTNRPRKRAIKKNARFQKYDSKEPGGVKSTTVEIKEIIT